MKGERIPNRLPAKCGADVGLDLRTLRSGPEPKLSRTLSHLYHLGAPEELLIIKKILVQNSKITLQICQVWGKNFF